MSKINWSKLRADVMKLLNCAWHLEKALTFIGNGNHLDSNDVHELREKVISAVSDLAADSIRRWVRPEMDLFILSWILYPRLAEMGWIFWGNKSIQDKELNEIGGFTHIKQWLLSYTKHLGSSAILVNRELPAYDLETGDPLKEHIPVFVNAVAEGAKQLAEAKTKLNSILRMEEVRS